MSDDRSSCHVTCAGSRATEGPAHKSQLPHAQRTTDRQNDPPSATCRAATCRHDQAPCSLHTDTRKRSVDSSCRRRGLDRRSRQRLHCPKISGSHRPCRHKPRAADRKHARQREVRGHIGLRHAARRHELHIRIRTAQCLENRRSTTGFGWEELEVRQAQLQGRLATAERGARGMGEQMRRRRRREEGGFQGRVSPEARVGPLSVSALHCGTFAPSSGLCSPRPRWRSRSQERLAHRAVSPTGPPWPWCPARRESARLPRRPALPAQARGRCLRPQTSRGRLKRWN